jgi:hypothetical protein
MVAVAWATAPCDGGGGGEAINAAASNNIGMTRNALGAEW